MSLPKQSRQRKAGKRPASNSAEARFQREWERVANLRKQNQKLRAEMDAVLARTRERVLPVERERQATLGALNQRLIDFMSRKTLPDYLRHELIEWIHQNLAEIQANPFCEYDVSPQLAALESQFASLRELEFDKLEKRLKKQGFAEADIKEMREQAESRIANEDARMDDLFEELFEEDEQSEDSHASTADEDEDDEWLGDYVRQQQARLALRETELEQLLKATPINGLFRRIARELHPDREIDPARKQEKHELMTRLIVARDEKDITTIISMYVEHVGEVPAGLFDGDFDKLTELLRYQCNKLRDEKESIYAENPGRRQVYEMFSSKNDFELTKKINQYLKDMRELNAQVAAQAAQLSSVQKLRASLEARYRSQLPDWELDPETDYPF